MSHLKLSSAGIDNYPQSQHTRVPLGGHVAVNGRSSSLGSAPYLRMQNNMEDEIHNLEQIAYGAVLRAFKAQSDALSWEKEGLITELRRELRVSDDEHRELLNEVNADDVIHRIREWRKSGGGQNVAPMASQHMNTMLPSPTVSASRRKQMPFMSNAPSHSVVTTQPLSSVKWGPSLGIGGRRPHVDQSGFAAPKSVPYQYIDNVSSAAPVDEPSESTRDPLVGRKVMIRWPADNNFYEAVITDYNPHDGRHSLVYDSHTPNATLEWVNMKEVPFEDIRWLGDDPMISQLGEAGESNSEREKRPSTNQLSNEIRPSGNGVMKEDLGEIEILHTDTLIKKVEKVLHASNPDLLEIGKAKKLLKEHEQTLIQVITKLADICDNGNEDNAEADFSV